MQTKFILQENEMPEAWYNIVADLPSAPAPVIHPGTKQPIGPADLAPLFPMALIQQEVSVERHIPIPEEVRDVYRLYRPTPLYRAHRLERALDTPAISRQYWDGRSSARQRQLQRTLLKGTGASLWLRTATTCR